MQDRAGLIHAKLPHEFHADLPGLVRAQTTEFDPEPPVANVRFRAAKAALANGITAVDW